MKAVVRKRAQRLDQGKSSIIRIRGKTIDYAEVVKYWDRKRVSVEDIVTRRAASATPEAVECSTPISRTVTPELLVVPERVLKSIRDYYEASFESGTWVTANPGFECRTVKVQEDATIDLEALISQCLLACRLFAMNSFQEAGQTLICATGHIRKILLAEHPRTLASLFALITDILQWKRHEIAVAVLRQFSAMGQLLLGDEHPLRRICGWLASVDQPQAEDVLIQCLQSVGDRFEKSLGPLRRFTLNCRLAYLRGAFRERDPQQQEEVALRSLLSKCVQNLGSHDVRTLNLHVALAHHCLRKHDYAEAEIAGHEILERAQYAQIPRGDTYYFAEGLYILAFSAKGLGQARSAEMNLRRAIELRSLGCGRHDGRARVWLLDLENLLTAQGLFASAAQVRGTREEILNSTEHA